MVAAISSSHQHGGAFFRTGRCKREYQLWLIAVSIHRAPSHQYQSIVCACQAQQAHRQALISSGSHSSRPGPSSTALMLPFPPLHLSAAWRPPAAPAAGPEAAKTLDPAHPGPAQCSRGGAGRRGRAPPGRPAACLGFGPLDPSPPPGCLHGGWWCQQVRADVPTAWARRRPCRHRLPPCGPPAGVRARQGSERRVCCCNVADRMPESNERRSTSPCKASYSLSYALIMECTPQSEAGRSYL